MSEISHGIDYQEQISRLSRRETQGIKNEGALVTATGTAPPAWAVKIISLSSYNVYNVKQVSIESPGMPPVVISGSETQTTNLAESFISSGQLSPGTYAVMWRTGSNNVIYVEP